MSTLRRIAQFHVSTGQSAKVFKDTEWNEYRVKFYDEEGQHMTQADYHTDDKQDAEDTARHQLIQMKQTDTI